jgi:methanogenic corrinoid protein MtbC1
MTAEYAAEIGADRCAKNAMDSVRYAEEVLGKA